MIITPKMWLYAGIALGAIAVIGGAYGIGYSAGKSKAEVRYVKAENKALERWSATVENLSASWLKLVEKSTVQRQQVRTQTAQVISRGTEYVETHVKPEDRSRYDLPEYLFALRLCQMDALYKAARADLPRERMGEACPPSLPGIAE